VTSGTTGDPVKRVSVLSTGTVDIHPEHALGTRKPLLWWVLTSRRWLPGRPINVYVIEHSLGLVLFDTGQDRASVTDSDYFPAGFNGLFYRRLARFNIGPADTLTEQMSRLGYSIADVQKVVLSHLHQDHIGGLRELLHADIILSDEEWADMLKPNPEGRGILRKHIDIPGLKWNRVSFAPTDNPALAPFTESIDLMGDGSLVLLPTVGHTPGSLSLLVRRKEGMPLLMVGDLTYASELLEQGQISGVGNKAQLRASTAKVNALKAKLPGLTLLPAHDPGAAERLQAANVQC
jgi:glyoxylase-like metal-dependent hydrolase (beta-lactamase superfamily II)